MGRTLRDARQGRRRDRPSPGEDLPPRSVRRRPVHGDVRLFQDHPHWRDHISFYEYFHGDNGAGLGASHQTGWTSLVAELIAQQSSRRESLASLQEIFPVIQRWSVGVADENMTEDILVDLAPIIR